MAYHDYEKNAQCGNETDGIFIQLQLSSIMINAPRITGSIKWTIERIYNKSKNTVIQKRKKQTNIAILMERKNGKNGDVGIWIHFHLHIYIWTHEMEQKVVSNDCIWIDSRIECWNVLLWLGKTFRPHRTMREWDFRDKTELPCLVCRVSKNWSP